MHMKIWQQNPAHEFFLKIQGIDRLGIFYKYYKDTVLLIVDLCCALLYVWYIMFINYLQTELQYIFETPI